MPGGSLSVVGVFGPDGRKGCRRFGLRAEPVRGMHVSCVAGAALTWPSADNSVSLSNSWRQRPLKLLVKSISTGLPAQCTEIRHGFLGPGEN